MRFAIDLPRSCLVVLVGAAGSGKSTFAARHFAPDEILASDAFRARLGRDASDQAVNGRVFDALHAALERRLWAGRTTVVDATNVRPAARRALTARAAAAGLPAVAIVLDLPLADCLAGDRARPDRHVPPAIIEDQWVRLRTSIDGRTRPRRTAPPDARANAEPDAEANADPARPFVGEGFAAVHRMTSRSDVDGAVVRRGAGRWPTLGAAPPPGHAT